MKHKSYFWGLGVVFIASLLLVAPRLFAQDAGRAWALKAGAGGIFTGHISGEVEVFLKGRVSIAMRGALIRPNLDSLRGPAEGFFIKVGPKFYFSKEKAASLAGFAVKPEVVLQHWRDWTRELAGFSGPEWHHSLGLTCNLSYNLQFGNFCLEPNVGIGYVPNFDSYTFVNDSPPYESIKRNWIHTPRVGEKPYNQSHLSIYGDLAMSGGLLLGVKF
jgi:hypothetical protein